MRIDRFQALRNILVHNGIGDLRVITFLGVFGLGRMLTGTGVTLAEERLPRCVGGHLPEIHAVYLLDQHHLQFLVLQTCDSVVFVVILVISVNWQVDGHQFRLPGPELVQLLENLVLKGLTSSYAEGRIQLQHAIKEFDEAFVFNIGEFLLRTTNFILAN